MPRAGRPSSRVTSGEASRRRRRTGRCAAEGGDGNDGNDENMERLIEVTGRAGFFAPAGGVESLSEAPRAVTRP